MADQPGKTPPTTLNNVSAPPAKTGIQPPPAANVIAWSVGSDGTFSAQTSGQQLALTAAQLSDGSVQLQLIFSRSGQAPYLMITSLVQPAKDSVSLTLTASPSQLTLAISNINQAVTLGTATISGSFGGQAVNWTGSFDMSTNPLVGKQLPGWPANAFAAELAAASVFGPLAWVLNVSWPTTVGIPVGTGAPLHMDLGWAGWTIVKSLVVGGIAALAAAATAPVSVPTIAIFGLAAADASVWSDLISQFQIDDVKPTAAVYEPPVTETVPVPVRSVSQEPPPPPGPPVLPSGFQAGAGEGTPPVVVVGPIVIDPPDPPPPPPPGNGDNPPGNGDGGDGTGGDDGGAPGGAVLPGDGGGGDDGGEIDDKPTHQPD